MNEHQEGFGFISTESSRGNSSSLDTHPVKKTYTKFAYRLETKRIKEADFPYTANAPLLEPAKVAAFAQSLEQADIEKMLILFLNSKNKLICIQVTTGTLDRQVIYPREIVKHALLAGAHGVIMVHNHPSGNVEPSPEDISLTKAIKAACKVLEIALLDHIIIGEEGKYVSFLETGIMPREV